MGKTTKKLCQESWVSRWDSNRKSPIYKSVVPRSTCSVVALTAIVFPYPHFLVISQFDSCHWSQKVIWKVCILFFASVYYTHISLPYCRTGLERETLSLWYTTTITVALALMSVRSFLTPTTGLLSNHTKVIGVPLRRKFACNCTHVSCFHSISIDVLPWVPKLHNVICSWVLFSDILRRIVR
jgi:hypothetical protein